MFDGILAQKLNDYFIVSDCFFSKHVVCMSYVVHSLSKGPMLHLALNCSKLSKSSEICKDQMKTSSNAPLFTYLNMKSRRHNMKLGGFSTPVLNVTSFLS